MYHGTFRDENDVCSTGLLVYGILRISIGALRCDGL